MNLWNLRFRVDLNIDYLEASEESEIQVTCSLSMWKMPRLCSQVVIPRAVIEVDLIAELVSSALNFASSVSLH